ncbi:hypothetical protein JNN96_21250 [Mycobacterium sp. DSM 3803]|uniref:hypothetical protein n=1 Tax=Mycolicibacterium sp. TaxID=2320850 RepID=UPI0037C5D87A|nr:hypothetical protein [Mycobacterium sp. DSM 3803]
MLRTRIAALSAATIVAALGLSGCSTPEKPPATPTLETTAALPVTPVAPPTDPLPAPDVLTGVLYRLADVNIPGAEKIDVVEQATPADAEALDKFGRALADNGFTPLTFEATDLAWSQTEQGNVMATIKVSTAAPAGAAPREFSFPMEFTPHNGGWQLTRRTADMLLEMGAAGGPPSPAPAPPPTPTP